jgi:hypothetical protein
VPPIHTPEVAARAILRAAIDKPRELWLGKAAFQAILGNMALPSVLDRMMAKRAWEGQLTDEDEEPNRPDNLYGPVEGLARASGRFSERAVDKAMGLSAETVGKLITITVVFTAVIVGVVIGMIAS